MMCCDDVMRKGGGGGSSLVCVCVCACVVDCLSMDVCVEEILFFSSPLSLSPSLSSFFTDTSLYYSPLLLCVILCQAFFELYH